MFAFIFDFDAKVKPFTEKIKQNVNIFTLKPFFLIYVNKKVKRRDFLIVEPQKLLTFAYENKQTQRQDETIHPFHQDARGWQRLHLRQHIII